MHTPLHRILEKRKAFQSHVLRIAQAPLTKKISYTILLVAGVIFSTYAGLQSARIASGLQEGAVFAFLPQQLSLLFSGMMYIDRFAGVFGVILFAILALLFTEGSRGALTRGIYTGILVLGVVTASTPFTLVAWLVIAMSVCMREVAKKAQGGFLLSVGAIILSVLMLSGGAFLADMTIVATISSELPSQTLFLALILLFGGALWSVRSFSGAYVLIPIYITLRICLFFLGSASVPLLIFVVLIAALCALSSALTESVPRTRAFAYLALMCIPLTMLAVGIQNITAVQCFLFGGLALLAGGVFSDVRTKWPAGISLHMLRLKMFFTQSGLPGLFTGIGAVLVGFGFLSLGEGTQGIERAYVVLLSILTLLTLLALGQRAYTQEIRTSSWNISGILQALVLILGGLFFAQALSYLGTTLGGEIADAVITVPLLTTSVSFAPWMLFLGSIVVVLIFGALKRYQPSVWNRVALEYQRLFAWLRVHAVFPSSLSHYFAQVSTSLLTRTHATHVHLEKRLTQAPLMERFALIITFFIVTLIILF